MVRAGWGAVYLQKGAEYGSDWEKEAYLAAEAEAQSVPLFFLLFLIRFVPSWWLTAYLGSGRRGGACGRMARTSSCPRIIRSDIAWWRRGRRWGRSQRLTRRISNLKNKWAFGAGFSGEEIGRGTTLHESIIGQIVSYTAVVLLVLPVIACNSEGRRTSTVLLPFLPRTASRGGHDTGL
jgi:hypothetical protein